jgi:putative nucleotidyltransferase with HDIG domain
LGEARASLTFDSIKLDTCTTERSPNVLHFGCSVNGDFMQSGSNLRKTLDESQRKPEENTMTRESAWGLLTEFTQTESLRKHALAVEACMRAYARKLGGDEEKWAITGLLHDFDYERWPSLDEHPYVGNKILAERGYPDDIRRAIMSHAEYSGVTRETPMEKALFACDELAGFITATALVKPGKSLAEVEAKSVRKKMKDKAFARSVNRDDITKGAEELGVDLEEHIAFCIEAMKAIARELGLAGTAA